MRRRQQRLQRQRGIADQRVVGGEVFIDVGRIQRGVDDDLARRHRHTIGGRREAASDAKDEIRVRQEMVHRLGHGAAT